MYKYKDKKFEIIEMTSPSNRLSWSLPIAYEHISRELLEAAIDEVFTVREDTPRITRRRRSGMSAMASAVEIQRTIGIP